jgi:hypothetical protein
MATTAQLLAAMEKRLTALVNSRQCPLNASRRSYLPVIPGEAGYGMHTPAGRHGKVLKVTTLNATGSGSLKAAVEADEPRVIVFEVSGNINLAGGDITVREPFLTIAGQTAPPPGISIINGSFRVATHDVLVQHIRTRGGLYPERNSPAAIDNYRGTAYNIVMDHVSTAWSTDDLVQTWWGAHDVTWTSVLATGELNNPDVYFDATGKCMITDSMDYNILMQKSALLTAYQRMPLAKANPFVFVNNVVYNWGGVGTYLMREGATSAGEFVFVGNHYRKGPLNAQAWSPKPILLRDFWVPATHIYLDRNYAPDWTVNKQWDLVDNRTSIPQADIQVNTPGAWPEGLVAKDGREIFDPVLDGAGAFPRFRDSLDHRLVTDCRNRTGAMISSTTFPMLAENRRALTLPDNPNADSGDGYTNLEKWLHEMANEVE